MSHRENRGFGNDLPVENYFRPCKPKPLLYLPKGRLKVLTVERRLNKYLKRKKNLFHPSRFGWPIFNQEKRV